MTPRAAWTLGGLLCLAGLVAAGVLLGGGGDTAPEALLERCRASRPEWAGYQEDIKGQIGAGPVAAWKGELTAIVQRGGTVSVTFHLEPPWSGFEAALPVLLRDPMGGVHYPGPARADGALREYTFVLGAEASGTAFPWLEVRAPRRDWRVTLDADGRWRAAR